MLCGTRGVLAVSAMLAAGALAAGAEPAIAKSVEQELAACRALANRDARTDCYDHLADEVARAAAQVPSAPAAPASPAPEAPAPQAQVNQALVVQAPAASQSQGAPVVVANEPAPASTEKMASRPIWSSILAPNADGVTVAISSAERIERGRLRMVTADGMTWDQSEDFRIRSWPSSGDTVTISKSAFGYWCRLSRRDLFHCVPRRKKDK